VASPLEIGGKGQSEGQVSGIESTIAVWCCHISQAVQVIINTQTNLLPHYPDTTRTQIEHNLAELEREREYSRSRGSGEEQARATKTLEAMHLTVQAKLLRTRR
jgi:hypothetical protein